MDMFDLLKLLKKVKKPLTIYAITSWVLNSYYTTEEDARNEFKKIPMLLIEKRNYNIVKFDAYLDENDKLDIKNLQTL